MHARFEEMTRDEIGAVAPGATAVVPVAATEQHGPHLAVHVDTRVAQHVAAAAADRAGRDVDVVTCPTMAFGASHHHLIYPGALSLSTDTLLRVLHDLGESLVRSGFRRIVFLNGHGGNDEVVRLAARELALRHDVVASAGAYWTIAWEALERDGRAFSLGRVPGHAGGFETSLMLAVAPALVRRDALPPRRDDATQRPGDPAARPLVHRHGSWREIDGYSDDARAADAARGAELLDLIAEEVAAFIVQFHRSLPHGAPSPSRS
jgi:creatinine amidohydrolase